MSDNHQDIFQAMSLAESFLRTLSSDDINEMPINVVIAELRHCNKILQQMPYIEGIGYIIPRSLTEHIMQCTERAMSLGYTMRAIEVATK